MGETPTLESLRRLALRLLYEVEQHNMDYHHRTSPGLIREARWLLGLDQAVRTTSATASDPDVETTGGQPGEEDP